MPIKNEMGEVVLFLFSFKDITQSGGPGLGPSGGHGDSNHGNCKSGGKTQIVRGPCHRSRKTCLYPDSWDVPPLISVLFFPTENSLSRKGASSGRLSTRRRSRTALHRLTGHFGRRGHGGVKTNSVSPISTPAFPSRDAEASCYCLPVSLSVLSPSSDLSLCLPISHVRLCSIPCPPTFPSISISLASLCSDEVIGWGSSSNYITYLWLIRLFYGCGEITSCGLREKAPNGTLVPSLVHHP